VPIVDLDGEAAIVATLRPSSMTFHRGDWVFPGGRLDDTVDTSPEDAARREASEELGVPVDAIDVVAGLDLRGPIMTGFLIHPFVGILAPGTVLAPDPREVAAVEIVPLSRLLADGAFRTGSVMPGHDPGPAAETLRRPPDWQPTADSLRFFALPGGDELWGTQGDILFDLLAHLTSVPTTRP
jgi:8-oxo-dGTP pyrophosphatase MutT (NUDIX family)